MKKKSQQRPVPSGRAAKRRQDRAVTRKAPKGTEQMDDFLQRPEGGIVLSPAVYDQLPAISGPQLKVYVYLCAHYQGEPFPTTIQQIGAATGLGNRTVVGAVNGLIERDLVTRIDGSGAQSNRYEIPLLVPPKVAGPTPGVPSPDQLAERVTPEAAIIVIGRSKSEQINAPSDAPAASLPISQDQASEQAAAEAAHPISEELEQTAAPSIGAATGSAAIPARVAEQAAPEIAHPAGVAELKQTAAPEVPVATNCVARPGQSTPTATAPNGTSELITAASPTSQSTDFAVPPEPPRLDVAWLITDRYRKINEQEMAEVKEVFPDEAVLRQALVGFCGVTPDMPLSFFIRALLQYGDRQWEVLNLR